jgi:tetratricopeptide (TPR) repeat protein
MRHVEPVRAAITAALLACVVFADPVSAQAIGQGFELERQGHVSQAASLYEGVLRAEPANLPALLGLERVLPALGRVSALVPLLERAMAVDSNAAIRALAVRTFTVLEQDDSAAAVVRRWAAAQPHDPGPWREWAIALADRQRFDAAREVLLEGRRTLGMPDALAIETSELAQRTGDWQTAAAEWGRALSGQAGRIAGAVGELEEAPADQHERVIRALTVGAAAIEARQVAAQLLLGWGDPVRAWETLTPTLDPPTPQTALALRSFAERAGGGGPEVRRVRGLALARLGDLLPGPLAARARAEAVRALLDAGDRVTARQVLTKLAGDPAAPPDAQILGETALVETLIDDGQLDSATSALSRLAAEPRAGGEERERLRHALVRAWIGTGRLDRAEAALGADSSVDGLALRGWVRLYRGDLRAALELFRAAGPYAGDRNATTARTSMLALLEQVDGERSPELGAALLALARGDSSAALAGLRHAADRLPGSRGRPDVLLLAGRIAAAQGGGQEQTAAALFAEVVRSGGQGAAAPAAELEWARLLRRQAKPAEASAHLEHLILTYPGSAVVPEARRELERVKGAIPKS